MRLYFGKIPSMNEHDQPSTGEILLPLVKEDGIRPWHGRFAAAELPAEGGPGACIWLADSSVKNNVITELRKAELLTSEQAVTLTSGLSLNIFYSSSVVRCGNPVHTNYYCDNRWVGIARSPLPIGFAKPLSR